MATGESEPRTVALLVTASAKMLQEHLPPAELADDSWHTEGAPEIEDAMPMERARREARDLVAAVLQQPRFWPSVNGDWALAHEQVYEIERAVARRAKGAPLAYAVRSAQFRALTLYVDERVLIPRPETEFLIDRALARVGESDGGIAVDVGTGSGAIALALASEGRFSRVIATDVSHDALAVARDNAARCGASLRCAVEFRAGDALAPLGDLHGEVELLISNPPYIAFDELAALPPGVRNWEPALALSCADDGMAVTRAIVNEGGRLLRPGGILAFEVDSRRAQRVAALVRDAGAYDTVEVLPDLTGRERYVLARRRGTN